ncbi:MAG: Gluconeogenesis factor [Candidatus Omnitrophica bacterium]|nr:Gluconeogenesis factor [Candidatus Omnitrophota bacterium]
MRLVVVGREAVAAAIGSALSRVHVSVGSTADLRPASLKSHAKRSGLIVFDEPHWIGLSRRERSALLRRLCRLGPPCVVLSGRPEPDGALEALEAGASDYLSSDHHQRELVLRLMAVLQGKRRITCIGGGTGLFTLLLGLKSLPQTLLTSIVNMSDDGGSSGKLSQTFGILPPGDIRRSLVALSNAPDLMNQIIQHRFEKGGELHGHSFGNLFLTVLAEVRGSMAEAVRALSDILNIQGVVLPATTTLSRLVAEFKDGTVVKGESRIDLCEGRAPDLRIRRIWHEPASRCHIDAYTSILFADLVLIGPGDLYTSVLTNFAVDRLAEAVVRGRSKRVYICNLMTKPGETHGYTVKDHVREVVRYLGGDKLDGVIVSDTRFSAESIAEYAKKDQSPVSAGGVSDLSRATRAKIVRADVANQTELVRHDSAKLRNEVQRLADVLLGPRYRV